MNISSPVHYLTGKHLPIVYGVPGCLLGVTGDGSQAAAAPAVKEAMLATSQSVFELFYTIL